MWCAWGCVSKNVKAPKREHLLGFRAETSGATMTCLLFMLKRKKNA